jgi:CRISPR-associated endonuclease/helicase Cas3
LGLDEGACGRWLAFWCGAHDIGKVAWCFQSQGKTGELQTLLKTMGFDAPTGNRPHGELSTKVLAELLASPGSAWSAVSKQVALNAAVAVGGHHGFFPTDWDGTTNLLGNDRWAEVRREVLADLARLCGVTAHGSPRPTPVDDQSVWMAVAGLTSVADWIGSNQTFFEPVGNPALVEKSFDVDAYFTRAINQVDRALEELGWLGRAETTKIPTFVELFPHITEPRPLRTAVAEIATRISKPSLSIVEAPMGEGKTEAGWYAAECWDRRGGQGAYVALPTMATSNQMFERVGGFLEAGPGKKNLMLQHGKAALNDKFADLKYAATIYESDGSASGVVAEGWFAANKKHGLLAPYGVGTVDQALLAVLQTKHVFVRLFGLAGKCVILDEVHAYDAYMTTLMERLLRWLAALGCQVVLLSATLPKEKRLKLLKAYAGEDTPEPEDQKYPRVTTVSVRGRPESTHVEADPGRARTVRLGWTNGDSLVTTLRESLADGGCAAVIRNTVGLAQETYLELRDALRQDGIDVELFHARFPFGRRVELENGVLERFGNAGRPTERNKRVLVATQVVEQSLDLDFDMMVSDVAPVDLVLQRAGRLHRHEWRPRPKGADEPCLWLLEPQSDGDHVPDFGVSGVVYSRYVLFRSLLALRGKGGAARTSIELPDEIDGLIRAVYDEADPPAGLTGPEEAFWDRSKAEHQVAVANAEGEAETRQIRKPKHTGALARLVGVPREEDNPDLHPAHQALTRLTRPTVQLICLEASGTGLFRLVHDHSLIRNLSVRNLSAGGAGDVGRLLLGELNTAHPGVVRELWDSPRQPREWAEVGMLLSHHQITFVDGSATLGGYQLLLDNELGLRVIRDEGEDE